jgi:serine/threonine protein kinase
MIGQQIGEYKVAKKLGEGGMGMVFLAQHVKTGEKAAIKALLPSLFNNEKARERFLREAEVLAKLHHDSIVRMVGYHDLPQGCFIVMELAEGQTVDERLQKQGRIPAATALPWFIELCGGLAVAHEQGVVHRDLKPSNIMITTTGHAKLLDFGTAKLVAGDPKRLTAQGMTLGTLVYMSREQILGKAVDARSDLYSLGVTLYEVLTGRLPFSDSDERKLLHKITKLDPPRPSELCSAIPPELDEVILTLLSKEAAKRPASADELAEALRAVLPAASASADAAPPAPAGTKERTTKIDGPPAVQPVPGAFVSILHGPDKGKRFSVERNVAAVIGRVESDGGSSIVLSDTGVSTLHCSVTFDGSRFALKDLGSTNGIWVGKTKVRDHVLASGEQFAVGSTLLRVTLE